jgi:hypothetical protein
VRVQRVRSAGVGRAFPVVYRWGEPGGWVASTPLLDLEVRCWRTLATCRSEMRRLLAEKAGCSEREVVLEETFDLPEGLAEVLADVRAARREASEQRQRSLEVTRDAVRRLADVEPRLGMRDMGELVGVSYQRVQQLLSDEGRAAAGA